MNCACVRSVAQLCLTFGDPMDCSPPGSTVQGISQAKYHFLPPGDRPDPGIKPMSLVSLVLAGGFFIIVPPGKPQMNSVTKKLNFIACFESNH